MNSDSPLAAPISAEAMPAGRRGLPALWIILLIIAVIAALGISLMEEMKDGPLAFPDFRNWFNAFFVTTAATEPAGLYLVLGFTIITGFGLWLGKKIWLPETWATRIFDSRIAVPTLALFSLIFSAAGVWLVMHNRPLAADENMPDFQARIFLSGQLQETIPEKLRPIVQTFTPLNAVISADRTRWNQAYLPVYAALRAPFLFLHLQTLVNPLLGAVAMMSMAGVCRILWPEKPWLSVAGAAFVALSPQVLITGMTSYAMPAHLALNTVWLWLYLRPKSRWFWCAPIVGVLAVGLHSPFVHALFAAPFLLRLVLDRRWKPAAVFAGIYLAGCVGYYFWWHFFAPVNAASTGLFSIQRPGYAIGQAINFLNLMSWSALPVPLLTGLAIWKYRQLPVPLRDGAMACLLTFVFYAMISFDQGLGWGNRYFHGVLGCYYLLAVFGLDVLIGCSGKKWALGCVLSGCLVTVLLLIPLRAWQAEKFVRPFAVAQERFQKMDVDLVLLDPRMAWYSSDLRRNNPSLTNRPLISNVAVLDQDQAVLLRKMFPKRHFATQEELGSYGLSTRPWTPIVGH
ncbi:MAG: hypothetical protein ABIT76_06985 [Chthoniobacterales bacterium]